MRRAATAGATVLRRQPTGRHLRFRAHPNDTNGESHNDGKYAMYLTVTQPESGGANAIHAGENLNPVKTLRMRYDVWRKAQPASFK